MHLIALAARILGFCIIYAFTTAALMLMLALDPPSYVVVVGFLLWAVSFKIADNFLKAPPQFFEENKTESIEE